MTVKTYIGEITANPEVLAEIKTAFMNAQLMYAFISDNEKVEKCLRTWLEIDTALAKKGLDSVR